MVEQRPFKPLVGGSSPPAPTTIFPRETYFFPYLKNQNLVFFCIVYLEVSSGHRLFNSSARGQLLRREAIHLSYTI